MAKELKNKSKNKCAWNFDTSEILSNYILLNRTELATNQYTE